MLLTLTTWLKPKLTPEQLMVCYRDTGEKHYLEQLVTVYYDDLLHFLISQSDRVVAEDVCQKTWLKVIDKRAQFKTENSFKSWLFTIARRSLLDEFRARNKLTELDDAQLQAIGKSDTYESDKLTNFNNALMSLNFFQREAFILQQEEFSLSEIAEITGCEFETVKSRLRYAKQNLRKLLEDFADE